VTFTYTGVGVLLLNANHGNDVGTIRFGMGYWRYMDKEKPSVPTLYIQLRAELQFPPSDLVELPSAELGNDLLPGTYGGFLDAERLSDSGSSTEVPYDILFEHAPMLNIAYPNVKDGLLEESYPNYMETMGDRIKQLRQAKGWTQEQLGTRLGVTKVAVSQWETGGTSNVRLKTFLALAEELGTTPHYLIFGPERPSTTVRRRAG
jgi:DNA-binding XRE family transcriptional regulator